MKQIIFFLSFFVLTVNIANAQAGTLDKSFGTDGKAISIGVYDVCNAMVLQNDGRIVVGGLTTILNDQGFQLRRYNTDGSIDPSFGNDGMVYSNFIARYPDGLYSLVQQPDGKILGAGRVVINSLSVAVGLARYKTDGSLDSSFGINGLVITSSIASKVYTTDMVLQNDGKILVTGYKHNDENDNSTLFIVRYLPDGSLDESFSEDGIVLSVFATGIEPPSIAWQPDGKILIAADNPFADRFTIARYLSDGNLDPAFGTAGITIFNFPDITGSDLYDIALQQDGKIVAVGDTYQLTDGDPDMTVARFDTNGVIDNTFGNGKGFVVTEFGSDFSEAHSVAIQADGKIVVSGQSYNDRSNPIHFYYALARYLSNGGLDSTFSNNGLKTTDLGGFANSVANAIQQDGKILLAGNFYNEAEGNHIAIVRYNNDEIFPITYNKFTATQTKAFITLNWQTTTELNNSYFAVERSSNAVNYTSVAQVNSAATGAAIHDYAYTDKLPIAGSNYYRLKQVDKDGKYSYSKTVSINYLKPGSIQLYPNPAKDKLTAKGLNAANASTIVVLDIQGKQLLKFSAKAATYSFSIGSLAPGTYMVRVKDNNGTAVEKFVKQ